MIPAWQVGSPGPPVGSAAAGDATTPTPIAPATNATTSFLMVLFFWDRCFRTTRGGWGLGACSCGPRRSAGVVRPLPDLRHADSDPRHRPRLQPLTTRTGPEPDD